MQQTDRIDILTTQLAETDRRVLSQAWYSALHLAERSALAPRCTNARCALVAPPFERQPPLQNVPLRGTGVAHPAVESNRARVSGRESHGAAVAASRLERRVPKTALARHLERALLRHVPHAAATSFALRAGAGRVHLVVRSDGMRTRLVAVCSPSLRERVERALAQARFALAGHGVTAEVA
jgi:hypothetical protein